MNPTKISWIHHWIHNIEHEFHFFSLDIQIYSGTQESEGIIHSSNHYIHINSTVFLKGPIQNQAICTTQTVVEMGVVRR
jgi:hypothetical protein